jgi:hypothetical protein
VSRKTRSLKPASEVVVCLFKEGARGAALLIAAIVGVPIEWLLNEEYFFCNERACSAPTEAERTVAIESYPS